MINKIKQWFQFPPGIIPQDEVDINNEVDIDNHEEKSSADNSSDIVENNTIPSVSETNTIPQVKDSDLEFLFYQLLEGVVNGWQEKRIAQFLQRLEPKITLNNWLDWLNRYRSQLLVSPAPHTQLAMKMILLGESTTSLPFVKKLVDSAYEIGQELLNRRHNSFTTKLLPSSITLNSHAFLNNSPMQTTNKPFIFQDRSRVLNNIISLLKDNPLLTVNKEEDKEVEPTVEPMIIKAEVEERTNSETQPELISETIEPHDSFLDGISDFDTPSPLITIDNDLDSDLQPSLPDMNYHLSAEDIFGVALEKAGAGDLEKAISLWEEVVQLDPNFAPAWHNLGSAYAYMNRLSEAIDCFDKALAFNINDYLSWNDRGNALFRLQRWQEAIISWDRVLGIQPDFDQAWYHRGLALEKLAKYTEAMNSYKKCLSINSTCTPAQKRYQQIRLNTVIGRTGKRQLATGRSN
jgi:tetratricopeptide (TPR) repeat protein